MVRKTQFHNFPFSKVDSQKEVMDVISVFGALNLLIIYNFSAW